MRFLAVYPDFVSVVRVNDQSVEMRHRVVFAADFLLDEVVGAFVGEDDVDPFGGSANVRSEHDMVRSVAVHRLLIEVGTEDLHVTAAAVDVLFVFHLELDDKRRTLVAERFELGRDSVEASVLRRLKAFVFFYVAEEFPGTENESAHRVGFVRRRNPSVRVRV